MSAKKAKVKSERTVKKSEKEDSTDKSLQSVASAQSAESTQAKPNTQAIESTNKPVDIVRVRESINNLVGNSAEEIANKVIEEAKNGQLASAKYLFEAVGLYPPTEETKPKPKEDSLAYTLLRRMGLPTEPLSEEDPVRAGLIGNGEITTGKTEGIAEKKPQREAEEEREQDSSEEKLSHNEGAR